MGRNMEFNTTSIYLQNALAWLKRKGGIRRALNEGGTSSSKTFSILQTIYLILEHAKRPLLATIVSESLPHLKRGCIRDYFAIINESPDNNPQYNKTDHIYTFPNGSKIEFMGLDEIGKERGPRRDILYCNELNNLKWEVVQGLDVRTNLFTFADWNPTSEFWAHEKWIGKPENIYIHSTYLDALNVLPPEVVTNIESNRDTDPNWWNVYGLGRIGRIEGLVYPYFEQVDELPKGDVFYGLDFGYTNDPTALVRCVIQGKNLYCQELIYQSGLTNDAIAYRMAELGVRKGYDEIFADAAEPKSIEEIYQHGFDIKACPKGADSVEYGLQRVRQYRIHWTTDSLNGIKEIRNYRYITDKNGALTAKTTHQYSHMMDAMRYGVMSKTEWVPIILA